MATSSEFVLMTTAASKGVHVTPKRAFKNLVRDVAERLEDKEATDICFQMELPKWLEEKPALEVLRWLISHGKCSETNVQPLVELFKDIHREDLAGRVENFQKEFGHSCSVPESSHQNTSHTSAAEMQAAHSTLFESVSNCPVSVQDDIPSGIATTKAQQETSIASYEESCGENPLSGSVCSVASYGNAFLPSFTPVKPSGSHQKVSVASIPFTLESSSASSSLLEMPHPLGQYPPSGMMWRFPSNSSSGISQENMLLHSSNSDIVDPSVMAVSQYQPKRHGITYQRSIPWYCQSSVASLSTPMSVTDQNHGSSNSMSMLHPRHPNSVSPVDSRLPMCRSMSQDYHKPLRKNHYSALHRRHTFTPADRREKGTQHSAAQAPRDYSKVSEVSKEIPQNQMCSAQLPTCQNCYKPHTHCGQLDYPVHPISPSAPHLRCPGHYPPTRHHDCCCEIILRRGWDSGEESTAANEHEQFPQKNDHTVTVVNECLHHNSGPYNGRHKFDDIQSSDAESVSSVAIVSRNEDYNDNDCHLKQRNVSYLKKRYSVPVFQSQCLDINKDARSAKSAQNHRQSLDVSTLKRGSACMSTSSGNASTSNRSLTSVNTLIGSASNSKSPVSSPPMIRNKGDVASLQTHPVAAVSHTAMSKWRPVSGLFHTKPKPRLIEPNKLVWPVKRDKLNKYIYKHKTKLLRCKLNLELISEHEIGPSPKLSLQLHPYGAEEDSNKFITAKVSIESRRCRLHSDTRIAFAISAREGDPTSGTQIGQLQEKQEQITKSFFYIKQLIDHQELKNSSCDYIQVITSATLIMPSHH